MIILKVDHRRRTKAEIMIDEWIVHYQIACRLACFALIFTFLALWETKAAWRPWAVSRKLRWARHFSLSVISKILIKMLFPLWAMGAALAASAHNMGLLHQVTMPFIIEVLLGIIALDFVIYLQHRMMHRFSWFWRVHRVHHIDRELDVSTGLRFHPLEEIVCMAVKVAGIVFFGVPVLAVLLFEIWLNAATLFTHVNIRLDPAFDRKLRRFIVTPGMHRLHHSDTPSETNSNYGFCLSIWDRIFGTYVPYSKTGENKMVLGLEQFREPAFQTLENMLLTPFNIKSLKFYKKKPRKIRMSVEDKSIPHTFKQE